MRWPLIRLLRPKQWIKNALVLAPLVFTGSFVYSEPLVKSLVAAALFCVASSASYILNDLRDLELDRLHPVKKVSRPLAAKRVSTRAAKILLIVLYAVVLATFAFQPKLAAALLAYIALNVAYSLALKNIPVVDLFAISAGFVLRVFAGALALSVPLSFWMFITTLCLALHLAAIKRRQELHSHGPASRTVLQLYTLPLLDYYAQVAAIGALIFYGLFVATVRPELIFTIPFVIFGMFRYRYIVEIAGEGESPTEALWRDLPLALTVLAWAVSSAFALWPE